MDTYEVVLKYATALVVPNFHTAGLAGPFPEVDGHIRDKIARPHLGDWAGFLLEVLKCFAEREQDLLSREMFLFHFRRFAPKPELQKHCTDQGAAGRLLALRNRLAHGATLPDDEFATMLLGFEKDLRTPHP